MITVTAKANNSGNKKHKINDSSVVLECREEI
jgi:hypothetical protein